jgi:hypothetical protein
MKKDKVEQVTRARLTQRSPDPDHPIVFEHASLQDVSSDAYDLSLRGVEHIAIRSRRAPFRTIVARFDWIEVVP